MIAITVGRTDEREIKKTLEHLAYETRPTLKRAVNATARSARRLLADRARETYEVKLRTFNEAMRIERATNMVPQATIWVGGRPNELYGFKVAPKAYKTGRARPGLVRARVLKSGPMKSLVKDNLKAFVVRFKSEHTTLAERLGDKRLPLKVLHAPSNPKMIGSKMVYAEMRPEIEKILAAQVSREIDRTLRKHRLGL